MALMWSGPMDVLLLKAALEGVSARVAADRISKRFGKVSRNAVLGRAMRTGVVFSGRSGPAQQSTSRHRSAHETEVT